jgi:hypothetical protein
VTDANPFEFDTCAVYLNADLDIFLGINGRES